MGQRKIDGRRRRFLSSVCKWRFNLRSQKRWLRWMHSDRRHENTAASTDSIDFQLVPLPASSVTSRGRKLLNYICTAADVLAKQILIPEKRRIADAMLDSNLLHVAIL